MASNWSLIAASPVLEQRRHVVVGGELVEAQDVDVGEPAEDGAIEFGPLGERRADQQAAVAGAADAERGRAGVTLGDQPLRGGDEVVEDALLVGEHPGPVPRLAELAAAAQDGQRIDAAGLDPRRRERAERRPLAGVEAAVTEEQCRRRAGAGQAPLVRDEDRNPGAVLRRRRAQAHLDVASVPRNLGSAVEFALTAGRDRGATRSPAWRTTPP